MANRDSLGDAILYAPHETCHWLKNTIDKITARYDHGWPAQGAPAPYYAPANPVTGMDPMQILATLAFVAFLLQSLLGLIDRITMTTRVVQAREEKVDKGKRILDGIKKFESKKWDKDKNT